MHHGILGPGGVGGLIGAVLAKAGESVTLIVRPEKLELHPQELSLESKFGHFIVPVVVAAMVAEPLDVLWVTVKSTQLNSALESAPLDARVGALVPLLNGVDHVKMLRGRFGDDCVVPATIAVETERTAPGKIIHRSPFVRLNVAASGRERLETSAQQFRRFGFECTFVEDVTTLLWSKLVFLAPIALSTTAADSPIGGVVTDPVRWALLEAAVREACAVAVASGASVNANHVMALIKSLPPATRSSMQNDVNGKRMPELDAIAGPILRGAAAHGLDASAIKSLVTAIELKLQAFARAR